MVIAVDADNTLFSSPNWPEIYEVNTPLVERLKALQGAGHKVILWTCREGVSLFDAIETMREHGLTFDAVNMNIGNYDRRKVVADVYIDDRAVHPDLFFRMPERTLRRLYGGNTEE